jgi:hypothetical protein
VPPRPPAPAPAGRPASTTRQISLSESLLAVTTAASTRAEEATLLFSNIASMLDAQLQGEPEKAVPHHLRKSFYAFCQDISTVAQHHFDSHVRGAPRPPPPYTFPSSRSSSPITPPSAIGSPTPTEETTAHEPVAAPEAHRAQAQRHTPTYASVITRPTPTPRASHQPTKKALPKTPPPDNRLFVRLPEDHVLRAVSTYSIQNDLNKALEKKLVKEIQTTRTGFALCPLSPEAQDSLEALIPQITALFSEKGPCVVEKASNLVSYRIALIPRSFQGFQDNQVTQIRVTPEHLSSALTEELGSTPTQVVETRHSSEALHTFSSSWIARFPSGTPTLPRSPLLFGARASVKLLPKRVAVIQCNRCLMWHNERTCARLARCRLCGSTTHAENEHTPCSTIAHPCPPRCFHCHGPHPADSLECLLRPKPNQVALTKQQKAQIRQSCSAVSLRIKTASCPPSTSEPSPVRQDTSHVMEIEIPAAPSRPSTPLASQAPTIPPPTSQGSRYSTPSPSELLMPGKRLFTSSVPK